VAHYFNVVGLGERMKENKVTKTIVVCAPLILDPDWVWLKQPPLTYNKNIQGSRL
jgi:hypothetical protein